MTAEIKQLPDPKAASDSAFLDILRMYLDTAARERMTYLEVTYKTETMDKPSSLSIVAE